MLSRKKSSSRTRSTPSRTRSTPSRTRSTPSRTRSTPSNTKKKTSKNNSNITYTIPDVYTFFSHSCNFINNHMTNSTDNELRHGRKLVPKDCIIITYGNIGNENYTSDPLFIEFINMFKSGHNYFKEPLKYEKELKEIFGSTLHFHYSDYYGKIPRNSRKKFYADIKYDNNLLFWKHWDNMNMILKELIKNFDYLVVLEKESSKKESEIDQLSYDISKEVQMGIFYEFISHFNVDKSKIAKFINNNKKKEYIEYLKQNYINRLFKTGLYKLKTDLIVTDKAKYYLKSSEIQNMFKDSLIPTKFNFGHPNYNNIPVSTLLRELHRYKVNIKQSELFKSHPGIYYNFTCRVPCNSETPIEDVRIQRAFSNGVQNVDVGLIASTRPTSAKTPSHYNRILKEIEMNNDFK